MNATTILVEVTLSAASSGLIDFQLFGFKKWAKELGVTYTYARSIRLRKFKWVIVDKYEMTGEEASILNVVEELRKVIK